MGDAGEFFENFLDGSGGGDPLEDAFLAGEELFGLSAGTDVVDVDEEGVAAFVADAVELEFDGDGGAVAAQAEGFGDFGGTGDEVLEVAAEVVAVGFGDEFGGVTADEAVAGEEVEIGGGAIDIEDDAFGGGDEDGVGGIFEEVAETGAFGGEGEFGFFAGGDIASDAAEAGGAAVAVTDDDALVEDPADGAAVAEDAEFEGEAAVGAAQSIGDGAEPAFAVAGVEEAEDAAGDGFVGFGGEAGEAGEGGAEVGEFAFAEVEDPEDVFAVFGEFAELFFAGTEFFGGADPLDFGAQTGGEHAEHVELGLGGVEGAGGEQSEHAEGASGFAPEGEADVGFGAEAGHEFAVGEAGTDGVGVDAFLEAEHAFAGGVGEGVGGVGSEFAVGE